MADLLDIPQSTYARLERNETSVELERLASFATALNVPIFELLPETLSMTNNTRGQGAVIFGNPTSNNYYYYSAEKELEEKDKTILSLKQQIELLEKKVTELQQKKAV